MMNVKPQPGWALVQIIKEDFEMAGTKENPIMIPHSDKGSAFWSRVKVLAINQNESETATRKKEPSIKVGDIAVMSQAGANMGVGGLIRNEDGKYVDVMITLANQLIAVIEGDIAEDIPGKPSKIDIAVN